MSTRMTAPDPVLRNATLTYVAGKLVAPGIIDVRTCDMHSCLGDQGRR